MSMVMIRFVLGVVAVLSGSGLAAYAEKVDLKFSDCGRVTNRRGTYQDSAAGSRFVFSDISLGGECGTVQSAYLQGQRWNNYLEAGMQCKVTATLRRRSGKSISGKTLLIKNEKGELRKKIRTDSKGKISTTFNVAASGPVAYVLIGPKLAKSRYVACVVYWYDHMV